MQWESFNTDLERVAAALPLSSSLSKASKRFYLLHWGLRLRSVVKLDE